MADRDEFVKALEKLRDDYVNRRFARAVATCQRVLDLYDAAAKRKGASNG